MARHKHKGMTSENAALKKIGGHIVEYDFAELIGGEVNKGDQKSKKDVIDKNHRTHSVKNGKKWQIFLYGRNRLEKNTILQTIGNVAKLLVDCIDSFPPKFEDFVKDKKLYRTKLQKPMHLLCNELQNETVRKSFFEKSMFEGSQVDYLTIKDLQQEDVFHIFPREKIVEILNRFAVKNSQKQKGRPETMDAQKVIFKHPTSANKPPVTIGEIEMRTDSVQHHREVKLWLDAKKFMAVLQNEFAGEVKNRGKINVYGAARKTFKPI